ncbi:class D sortase ['Paenibacillus yunnanensis' Narsing Rao et al. 2020]|uniref:class D sortase n=1 Tax=Paenibacillus tengchongensis TaxID=2608684 RepID=UPI00124C23A2|nr:class D sortase [Paenibacillus tengchongensis]
MQKKRSGLVLAVKLILMLSLCVLVYSVIQVFRGPAEAQEALSEWTKKREEAVAPVQTGDEIPLTAEMAAMAEPADPAAPGSANKSGTAAAEYAEGEVIGEISFPRLGKRVAILEGTGKAQLKKGAGHYAGSAVIGANGNSVLAGHRDSVFRGLGDLQAGDRIEVETADGRFTYEVTGSVIVDEDARGAIKPSTEPLLTLITCYPFGYVGPAPDRYLLSASLLHAEPLVVR